VIWGHAQESSSPPHTASSGLRSRPPDFDSRRWVVAGLRFCCQQNGYYSAFVANARSPAAQQQHDGGGDRKTHQKLRRFQQIGRSLPARTQRNTSTLLRSMSCEWQQKEAEKQRTSGPGPHSDLSAVFCTPFSMMPIVTISTTSLRDRGVIAQELRMHRSI